MDFLWDITKYFLIRKKYWLLPLLIFVILFGGLIVISQGSALSPFIYTLF